MTVRILLGDCIDIMATLEPESVHTIVTSPPYWGLRDYGADGQLGLEATPQEYVDKLVAMFRVARRALRDDGTLWLNLGDTYVAGGSGHNGSPSKSGLQGGVEHQQQGKAAGHRVGHRSSFRSDRMPRQDAPHKAAPALRPKNLVMIPARVALALQADGWYLRQDIIWHKKNPMPESVRDRCTKAHEYLFLLSKSERYYFDAAAIAEPAAFPDGPNAPDAIKSPYGQGFTRRARGPGNKTHKGKTAYEAGDEKHRTKAGLVAYAERWRKQAGLEGHSGNIDAAGEPLGVPGLRNKRSVWSVASQPFADAHFATFPPALIEPCILAGAPRGGLVLDPFGGAGTTGLVADRHHRDAILIELNKEYAAMAEKRIRADSPLFAEVS